MREASDARRPASRGSATPAAGESARGGPALEVFYDGECPLCRREIHWLRSRTPRTAVEFTDFTRPGFDFSGLELDRETLMGRVHARLPDGRVVTGVEVFRRLYVAAGLGWVVAWTRWPLLDRLSERAYRLFARYRLPLTGRPKLHRLERRARIPASVRETFAFFCDPDNLESITPPQLRFRILSKPSAALEVGSEIQYSLRLRGIPFRWHTRIREWVPGSGFVDEAVSSPFASWSHRHVLEPAGADATDMLDVVDYRMPMGVFGELFHPFVRAELERIFDFRAQAIHDRFRHPAPPP